MGKNKKLIAGCAVCMLLVMGAAASNEADEKSANNQNNRPVTVSESVTVSNLDDEVILAAAPVLSSEPEETIYTDEIEEPSAEELKETPEDVDIEKMADDGEVPEETIKEEIKETKEEESDKVEETPKDSKDTVDKAPETKPEETKKEESEEKETAPEPPKDVETPAEPPKEAETAAAPATNTGGTTEDSGASTNSGSIIVNANNGKIHDANANSSHFPKEKNRIYFDSLDDALNAGYYDYCKICY